MHDQKAKELRHREPRFGVTHVMALNLTREESIAQRRSAVGEPTVMRTRQVVEKDEWEQPA
jgi:hypothetical protein